MPITVVVESERSEVLLDQIRAGIRRHTEANVPWEQYTDLTIVAYAPDGSIAGAVLAQTGRGWLNLSVVWVDEALRGQGIGSGLVKAAESEARSRGCHSVYLDTFSYQAPTFYEKLGYQTFGTLDDYPKGHQRIYMSRQLSP